MQARKYVLASACQGFPNASHFKLVEETLPELQEEEILVKAEWLSVDPYMRGRIGMLKPGDTIPGEQIARVLKSNCKDFPEDILVVGFFGWRDATVYKVPPQEQRGIGTIYKVIDLKSLPVSYALGSCGMPGNTAYFGFLELCQPKAGETVVVSAAAGAVGSIVGQIAKIKGCKVIGYAGTEDKVKWLKELGFDHAFNYKTCDVYQTLQESAPEGVDCYFDNVGGEFSYHVSRNLKLRARIALCGAIDTYNRDKNELPLVPFDYGTFIYKQIRLEGFIVTRWAKQWFDGLTQLRDWIVEGKIQVQETKVEGFESMPQAFLDLFTGKNTGKMIIKA